MSPMKRFAVLTVSTAFLISSMAVSAQTLDTIPNSVSVPVQANYQCLQPSETVYSVDVQWEEMKFTYTHTGNKTWNPETHQYELEMDGFWSTEGSGFTVTNHSNADVNVDFDFTSQIDTISGSFSQPALSLPTAENRPVQDPELTGVSALTLSGFYLGTESFSEIGSVTVTIQ